MSVKTFKEGIKLDPQSADPTATEGQVQFSDGTVRPKGLYQYKDGAWASIGGGAGDADTIHLIKAADSQASDFTIKSIDDIMPDPEGSDTLAGTFSIPSSGSEALLSNDDDHKVFKFASAASSQYDAWGISKSIPRYVRGEDVVLQFKYRTADTSGDSADGDYMIWVWDETNGVNTTTTSTGSVSAGTAITVGTTTGMSVGDKIWVGETGGTAQVTEAHVTEVTSGTQVKISETVNLSSGDRFVTGILTDVLTTLDAADDDTNKTGNDFKVVFNVPSTCASVALLFQQLTSQTDSFLYVDNILVSSEVVKRVFAKDRAEHFKARTHAGYGSSAAFIPYFSTEDSNTVSKYGILVNNSTDGLKFTASVKCKVHATYTNNSDASGADAWGFTLNSSALGSTLIDTADTLGYVEAQTTGFRDQASISIIMEPGDILRPHNSSAFTPNNSSSVYFNMIIEPEVNDVVVVESTDSVISEWTAYTPTFTSLGTCSNIDFLYRRVGENLEVRGVFQTGTTLTAEARVSLPNGLQVQSDIIGSVEVVGRFNRGSNWADGDFLVTTAPSLSYVTFAFGNATGNYNNAVNGTDIGSTQFFNMSFSVPIAGWDANPKPLLAFPTITYGQDAEHFLANTHAGYGSGAAFIPYFTNAVDNTISNLGTLVNDSTDGCKFTASKRCKVTVSYTGAADGSARTIGISKNSSQLGTAINTITASDRLAAVYCTAASTGSSCSFTGILEPGDVIRPHNSAAFTPSTTNAVAFSLLVEPEEGKVNQAAIISQPVAYCRMSSSAADVTVGSNTTITLDELNGDIAAVGVSLSSNDFTLPPGKYEIDWSFGMWTNGTGEAVGACQLYNVTDSKVVRAGTAATGDGTNYGTLAPSTGSDIVTITKNTTFRIRGQNVRNSGSHNIYVGWGSTNSNIEKGYVKIARKK